MESSHDLHTRIEKRKFSYGRDDVEKFKTSADILSLMRILRNWLEHNHNVFAAYTSCYHMVNHYYPRFPLHWWSCMVEHGRFLADGEFIKFKEDSLKDDDSKARNKNPNIPIEIAKDQVLTGKWTKKPADKIIYNGLYALQALDGFSMIYETVFQTGQNRCPAAVQFLDLPPNEKDKFTEQTNKLRKLDCVVRVLDFQLDVSMPDLFGSEKSMIVTEKFNSTLEDFV